MDAYVMRVRRDFDRIARLGPGGGDGEYDAFLASCLPPRSARALEVGCGAGAFTRRLAARAERVVAIDLSEEMIAVARARLAACENVELVIADATTWRFPDEEFDCAVSIATLHHLPFEETLARMARALVPGGVLLVHDLFRDAGLVDRALSAIALVSRIGAPRASPALRAAWAEHEKHDRFMTIPEVRARATALLPGARVKRHLKWRYSLVWRKPG